MPKDIWIIANWKSKETLSDGLNWLSLVGPNIRKDEAVKVVVCPSFTSLEEVKKDILAGGYPLMVGSQDLSPFPAGAYTGEESAAELRQFVDIAIIGHSERRKNFGETDGQIAQKVKQANKFGITPLVCVQSADTPIPEGCKLLAYEPVFAIGTGNPDTPENADQVAKELKLKSKQEINVCYGGSVTSENITSFLNKPNISGALIGAASLDPNEFNNILQAVYNI